MGLDGSGAAETHAGLGRRAFLRATGSVFGGAVFLASFGARNSTLLARSQRPPSSPASSHLVRFGHTDLWVSRYCQGTAFRQKPRSDNPDGRRILERCIDLGVNFFDTAEAYGWGGSETLLGRVIQGRRDRLVICTKAAPSYPPERDPDKNKFKLGEKLALTREVLAEKCEGSLRRLGTDYLDLYLIHSPDEITPAQEMVDSLDRLVRAGKIRYWGLSNFKPPQVAEFFELTKRGGSSTVAGIQDRFNVVARERLEPDMFEVLSSSLAILRRQNRPNSNWYRKNSLKRLFCRALL